MNIMDTAAEIGSFLDEQRIPYAIIGGIAVQYWGEARTTSDVDLVILLPLDRQDSFFDAILSRFEPRLSDAVPFALENRVLLISGTDGTPVDIALGIPGYEEEAIRRAVDVTLHGQQAVRLIGPEDLIIHKCIAGRPRDIEDIERVLVRQKLSVDLDYIREWLGQFAALIEDHAVLDTFENALQRAGSLPSDPGKDNQ